MKTILMVENIRLPAHVPEEEAFTVAGKKLKRLELLPAHPLWHIRKKSVDARNRSRIYFVYSVQTETDSTVFPETAALREEDVKIAHEQPLEVTYGTAHRDAPVTVVGFGPAGMFCGLLLAEHGYRPLIFERGAAVDERVSRVDHFMKTGELDGETNVQFGAGGAGTFSDGKLTTRINDPLCDYVIRRFCELGAPANIAWRAKPHVGTDFLRGIVRSMDRRIRELGGEIRYNSRVTAVTDGSLTVHGTAIPTSATVLAVGHSARDLYRYLGAHDFTLQPKAFSCGVRVEHLQAELDEAMYGDFAGRYGLEHADYALSLRRGERGVYSFCMCPGGYVMASSSEDGGIVTNGMSNYRRDGRNANAALAVSVLPDDYGNTPEGAIRFQAALEQKAFAAGGGQFTAPVQLLGDFREGTLRRDFGRITPTYRRGTVRMADLNAVLPPFVSSMLKDGFSHFGRMIRGFSSEDVPLTGVETRTSSPVRILRDETYTAPGYPHVYPCGEGAGYAGGIMSAAVDGIRTALAVMRSFSPD